MIPQANITAWRSDAPCGHDAQVEQDLALTRAVIELFTAQKPEGKLALRGGARAGSAGAHRKAAERVRRAAIDALRLCCPYGPSPVSPTPLLPPNLANIEGVDQPPRLESAFLRSSGYGFGMPYYTPPPAVRYLDSHYWSAARTLELEAQRTRR